MAPVALRFVVRFSSEDVHHKAENLLKCSPDAGSWKCAKDEISGQIEAEIQFEKACCISHLDIGNSGAAFVEILVGSSMWAHDKEYQTLLPSTTLMKPNECKSWTQTHVVRMFNEASFSKGALSRPWDRIRIICRQPFRKDKQFGLSFIRIASKDDEASSTSPSGRVHTPHFEDNDESAQHGIMRLKRASGLMDGPRNVKTSPNELLNRGAKMLHAALDSKAAKSPGTPRKRPSPHKGKRRKSSSSTPDTKWSFTSNFCEEVECFLEGKDFSQLDLDNVTFADLKLQMEMQRDCQFTREERKVFLKLVKKRIEEATEEAEQEAEQAGTDYSPSHLAMHNSKTAQSTSRKRPIQSSPATSTASPASSSSLLQCPSKPIITEDRPQSVCQGTSQDCTLDRSSEKEVINLEDDLCDFPPMLSCSPSKKSKVCMDNSGASVQCPLCMLLFPCDDIESHAALCMPESTASGTETGMSCPICLKSFPQEEIDAHADACAETMGCEVTKVHEVTKEDVVTKVDVVDKSCPICLKYFPPEEIDAHADACAESMGCEVTKVHEVTKEDVVTKVDVVDKSCPICLKYFPPEEIDAHADACAQTMGCEVTKVHEVTKEDVVTKVDVVDKSCPICLKSFPPEEIDAHADACAESMGCEVTKVHEVTKEDVVTKVDVVDKSCPICLKSFPPEEIDAHADACAERMCEVTKVDVVTKEDIVTKVDVVDKVEPTQEKNVITIW